MGINSSDECEWRARAVPGLWPRPARQEESQAAGQSEETNGAENDQEESQWGRKLQVTNKEASSNFLQLCKYLLF